MQTGHTDYTSPQIPDDIVFSDHRHGERIGVCTWPFSRLQKLQSSWENNRPSRSSGHLRKIDHINFEFCESLNKSSLLSIKKLIYEEWSCHVVWIHHAPGAEKRRKCDFCLEDLLDCWLSSAENTIWVQKRWRGDGTDAGWKDRLDRMQGLALSEALHCLQLWDSLEVPFSYIPLGSPFFVWDGKGHRACWVQPSWYWEEHVFCACVYRYVTQQTQKSSLWGGFMEEARWDVTWLLWWPHSTHFPPLTQHFPFSSKKWVFICVRLPSWFKCCVLHPGHLCLLSNNRGGFWEVCKRPGSERDE